MLISRTDDGVFVGEGFELSLARKLRDQIINAQPKGPIMTAGIRPHELSLGLSHMLSSFGIIRVAGLQRYTFEGNPGIVR